MEVPFYTLPLRYPGQFHNFDELEEEINQIHSMAPNLVDIELIGQSYQGRNITSFRITNELNQLQKAKTFIVAHHHGREQITIELALRFILHLINSYGVDPVLSNYVDTQEIYIIPSLNPDTLDYVVNEGHHWLRKNLHPFDNDSDGVEDEDSPADIDGDGIISYFDVYSKSGGNLIYEYTYLEGIDTDGDGEINEDPIGHIDLNRNYATGWGNPGSSSNPLTQIYHGPSAFSEPETQVLRDFVQNHRFAMAYSLHSGINTTYFPSFQSGAWVNPILYTTIFDELDDLLPPWYNGNNGYTSQSYSGARALQNTGEFGLWQDWMFAERNTIVPICFEVYQNASSIGPESTRIIVNNPTTLIEEWMGIYGYFNPVASHIDVLWAELLPAFNYLLALTPRIVVSLQGIQILGSTMTVTVSLHNLSPRLTTVEPIFFIAEDGTILDTTTVVGADSTATISAEFSPQIIGPRNIILIGNNYTGFVSLQIISNFTSNLIYIAIGVTIGIIAIVLIIYFSRRARI